jgi:hypothetical protein
MELSEFPFSILALVLAYASDGCYNSFECYLMNVLKWSFVYVQRECTIRYIRLSVRSPLLPSEYMSMITELTLSWMTESTPIEDEFDITANMIWPSGLQKLTICDVSPTTNELRALLDIPSIGTLCLDDVNACAGDAHMFSPDSKLTRLELKQFSTEGGFDDCEILPILLASCTNPNRINVIVNGLDFLQCGGGDWLYDDNLVTLVLKGYALDALVEVDATRGIFDNSDDPDITTRNIERILDAGYTTRLSILSDNAEMYCDGLGKLEALVIIMNAYPAPDDEEVNLIGMDPLSMLKLTSLTIQYNTSLEHDLSLLGPAMRYFVRRLPCLHTLVITGTYSPKIEEDTGLPTPRVVPVSQRSVFECLTSRRSLCEISVEHGLETGIDRRAIKRVLKLNKRYRNKHKPVFDHLI